MTTEPPFAPPYKLAIDTPDGRRWVEVLADGSRVETTPPATTLAPSAPASSAPPKSGGGKAQAFLNVPYAEKDEAKRLGARWDPARKKWYVPHGVDLEPFSRWTAS
jgi:hypothetical protein